LAHISFYNRGADVAPIEVSGFFKARKAETIPGYVTMSGTNPDAEAPLSSTSNLGFPLKIKFGSACLTTRSKLLPKNMLGTYSVIK
jgi:hypothetical protein